MCLLGEGGIVLKFKFHGKSFDYQSLLIKKECLPKHFVNLHNGCNPTENSKSKNHATRSILYKFQRIIVRIIF